MNRGPVTRDAREDTRGVGAVTHAFESSVAERLSVGGVELEVVRRGAGRPVLLLHGAQNVNPRARFLDLLGQLARRGQAP